MRWLIEFARMPGYQVAAGGILIVWVSSTAYLRPDQLWNIMPEVLLGVGAIIHTVMMEKFRKSTIREVEERTRKVQDAIDQSSGGLGCLGGGDTGPGGIRRGGEGGPGDGRPGGGGEGEAGEAARAARPVQE